MTTAQKEPRRQLAAFRLRALCRARRAPIPDAQPTSFSQAASCEAFHRCSGPSAVWWSTTKSNSTSRQLGHAQRSGLELESPGPLEYGQSCRLGLFGAPAWLGRARSFRSAHERGRGRDLGEQFADSAAYTAGRLQCDRCFERIHLGGRTTLWLSLVADSRRSVA